MTNNLKMVDDLGRLLARIAELEKQAEAIKDALREAGPGAYEGALFRATVSADYDADKFDNKAIREKLVALGHRRFVNAHCEKEPRRGAVRCVAKSGKETDCKAAAGDMAARGHAAAGRKRRTA